MEHGTDPVMSHSNVMFDVDQTIEDLGRALDYLRSHGWVQGKNLDRAGNCCAWGAVLMATNDSEDSAAQVARASNVARAFYRLNETDIVAYNDAEGRTKDQVIRAMETTLSSLKAKPSLLTAKKADD